MSGLSGRFLRARARLFGTAAKDIPVPFQVSCDCGGRAAGIRRASYQVAECSDCGRSLYVLPVNPYPATRRIHSEVVAGGLAGRAGAALRELAGEPSSAPEHHRPTGNTTGNTTAQDSRTKPRTAQASETATVTPEPAQPPERGLAAPAGRRSPGPRTAQAAAAVSGGAAPAVTAAPVIQPTPPVPLIPKVPLAVRLRRVFSPVRLLVTASLVLLALTVWWMVQQRRQDVARRVWRQQQDAAERALQAGDLPLLTAALERVVEAAGILRRQDAESQRAESLLRQCQAVSQLSQLDLVSSLEQLSASNRVTDERVTAEVRGLVFVFEAVLKPQAENAGILELDLPLMAGAQRVRVLTAAQSLRQLQSAAPQRPVLFAGTMQAGQTNPADGSLQLRLDDSSVVVLTEAVTAGAAGYSAADAGVAELLRQQQLSLGLAPAAQAGSGETVAEPVGAKP